MAAGEVAVDAVAEAAEFVSDESAHVAEVTRALSSRDVSFLFGGVGIGVSAGFAAGYFLLRKKLELKYESLADDEIASMKEHYNAKARALEERKEKKSLEQVVQEQGYAETESSSPPLGKTQYDKVPPALSENGETPPVVNVTNIFQQPEPEVDLPDWDYAEELKSRDSLIPYVIHKDEYTEGQKDYEQHTLTYFEGDDVLSDERDRVIEDQDSTIGLGNLSKFGHGSGDPNIVYIRNDAMKIDIEIVHSDGKFATEVHGFQEDELQHSSMRRRSPRRSDYDQDG